jgi:hypothetical protein
MAISLKRGTDNSDNKTTIFTNIIQPIIVELVSDSKQTRDYY